MQSTCPYVWYTAIHNHIMVYGCISYVGGCWTSTCYCVKMLYQTQQCEALWYRWKMIRQHVIASKCYTTVRAPSLNKFAGLGFSQLHTGTRFDVSWRTDPTVKIEKPTCTGFACMVYRRSNINTLCIYNIQPTLYIHNIQYTHILHNTPTSCEYLPSTSNIYNTPHVYICMYNIQL